MKTLVRMLCVATIVASPLQAKMTPKSQSEKVFYVYQDKGSRLNHFAPSGWMGDYGDIKINDGDVENPEDGKTSFKVSYLAKGTQGANWAGIFWQMPPNNWGERAGGYDISGFKKLTFWAKAPEGAKIAEFKVGGITGTFGDSDAQSIGPVELTKDWKKYTIDLAGKDLTHIIGGFCWSASRDDNPNGFTIYLDEVRFEN